MHDPSGCNSTYNTHDETRWTEMESLIFLSGLTQLDAITGNDRKLIDDIVKAAGQFHPAFIAIANSPVPWLIGTDFDAICRKVKEVTGIPAFHVSTNAMHDYTKGAGSAWAQLARIILPASSAGARREGRIRVNVLGMTPLDFTVRSDAARLKQILELEGFEIVSVWAMEDSLAHLKDALSADVNLVVSSTGLETAVWMEETAGIPYTAGIPVGRFAKVLFETLKRCAGDRVSRVPYLEILQQDTCSSCDRCAAGEPVTMGSIAAECVLTDQRGCRLVPLTETIRNLILPETFCPAGEQQVREALGQYREVIADPVLKGACREDCSFEQMPHFALSGRLFLDQIRPWWP